MMDQVHSPTVPAGQERAPGEVAPVRVLRHSWHADHSAWGIPAVADDLYPLHAAALLHRSVDHETICRAAQDLAPGEVLEVRSDHDVAPLLERIGRHCAALVSMTDMQAGPSEWVVRLTRGDPATELNGAWRGPTARSSAGVPLVVDLRGDGADGADALDRVLEVAATLEAGRSLVTKSRRPLPIYTLLSVWGFRQETARDRDGTWVATFTRPVARPGPDTIESIRRPLHGTRQTGGVPSAAWTAAFVPGRGKE